MMTTHVPDPERWTDRPDDSSSVEDLLSAAFRRAREATLPSEALCARLEAGTERRAPAAPGIHRWRVATVALAALLVLGTSVGAARGPLRAWAGRHGFLASPAQPSPEASRRPRRVAQTRAPEAAPIEAPPALAEALAVAAPSGPLVSGPTPRPAPVEAPGIEAPAAEEARVLGSVFRALRAEAGRAEAALAALDDYDRRFPAGLLRDESRLARVEALLALGRPAAARSLLEAWEAEGVPMPRAARDALAGLRIPGPPP